MTKLKPWANAIKTKDIDKYVNTTTWSLKTKLNMECIVCKKRSSSVVFLGRQEDIIFFCTASCSHYFEQEPNEYLANIKYPYNTFVIKLIGLGLCLLAISLLLIIN